LTSIVLATLALIFALFVGAYRHFVTRTVALAGNWAAPLGWQQGWLRYGSWLLVFLSSIFAATVFAAFVAVHVNEWIGRFSWGVIIAVRWLVSAILSQAIFGKRFAETQQIVRENERRAEKDFEQNWGISRLRK